MVLIDGRTLVGSTEKRTGCLCGPMSGAYLALGTLGRLVGLGVALAPSLTFTLPTPASPGRCPSFHSNAREPNADVRVRRTSCGLGPSMGLHLPCTSVYAADGYPTGVTWVADIGSHMRPLFFIYVDNVPSSPICIMVQSHCAGFAAPHTVCDFLQIGGAPINPALLLCCLASLPFGLESSLSAPCTLLS
jgi:hypothetical protein